MMKNTKGFSLIEALLSAVVLLIVVFESMNLLYKVTDLQKMHEKQLGLIASRNKILSLLMDERGWSEIVQDTDNSEFSCWLSQNSAVAMARDCNGKNQVLKLKWINGDIAYNAQDTKNGLTYTGENCNDFKDEPDPINKACPARVNLSWQAICSGVNCENPLLKIDADLKFRANDRVAPNTEAYRIRYLRSKVFCPTQALSSNLELVNAGVTFNSTSVVSNASGATPNSGMVRNNVDLYPCQLVRVNFEEQLVTTQAGLPNPLLMADANNTSSVCLAPPGGACEFIWRRTGTSYQLFHQATLVSSMPASVTFVPTTKLEFQVVNGLVRFCVDGHCHMFFDQKLVGPFRVYFEPSNSSYSGGFMNINITTSKSLTYSN